MSSPRLVPALLACVSFAAAQNTIYTFSDAADGLEWPDTIDPDDCWYDVDIGVCNSTGNTLMILDNYIACGNASGIQGDALWGNPQDLGGSYLNLDFSEFFVEEIPDDEPVLLEEVRAVAFDFAWASSSGSPANPPPLGTLNIAIYDWYGGYDYQSIDLEEVFPHGIGGSGEGRAGRVVLMPDDLNIFNISNIEIELDPLVEAGNGFEHEFALDNLEISIDGTLGGPSEVYPVEFDGSPANDYGTNRLKGTGLYGSTERVRNGGDQPTTFTVQWNPSDPALYDSVSATMVPIDAGETYYPGYGWEVDTDTTPSGEYSGYFTIINDNEPSDPDDTVTLSWFRLYDPPQLTTNTGIVMDPGTSSDIIEVSNAAAGPHAGALRASVEVTSLSFSNPRFTLGGVAIGEKLNPGGILDGIISFNAVGAPAGVNHGQLRMALQMVGNSEPYLNGRTPVPDLVWNLQFTVAPKSSDTKAVTIGQNLGETGLGINDPKGGATIGDGISGDDQDVSLSFNGSPPTGGNGAVNTPFDLGFTSTVPLYLLQIAYLDEDVPAGYAEQDLRIEVYDGVTMQWVPAISLNSNPTPPGAADPYPGSYSSYLSTEGGGVLDTTDLSAFGVDTVANHAWVILDHASTFRLSVGTSSQPPLILDVDYDAATNTSTLTYQSLPGEAFGVEGGSLGSLGPLPDTEVGDGSVKQYSHQPPGAPADYFYRMSRPTP